MVIATEPSVWFGGFRLNCSPFNKCRLDNSPSKRMGHRHVSTLGSVGCMHEPAHKLTAFRERFALKRRNETFESGECLWAQAALVLRTKSGVASPRLCGLAAYILQRPEIVFTPVPHFHWKQ